jgi:hypothetical protein
VSGAGGSSYSSDLSIVSIGIDSIGVVVDCIWVGSVGVVCIVWVVVGLVVVVVVSSIVPSVGRFVVATIASMEVFQCFLTRSLFRKVGSSSSCFCWQLSQGEWVVKNNRQRFPRLPSASLNSFTLPHNNHVLVVES